MVTSVGSAMPRPERGAIGPFGLARKPGAMMDPTTNPDSVEPEDIEFAPRVRGLPPYLFGKINELKYRKRRDGIDVIDLGMGNPTDPPEEWVVDKLCEAARDSRNHRYSVASGVYNLRREVAVRYESRFGVSLDPDHEVVATIERLRPKRMSADRFARETNAGTLDEHYGRARRLVDAGAGTLIVRDDDVADPGAVERLGELIERLR